MIGILFCTSCERRQADEAAKKESEEVARKEQIAKEEAAVEQVLSSLAERHRAQRNWLLFAEKQFGEMRSTLTLEYQDALKRLNGQPIIVVGHIIDVYGSGEGYRILCNCNSEPPRSTEYGVFAQSFQLDADVEAVRYVAEMFNQHPREGVDSGIKAYFVFVVQPIGLHVKYDRKLETSVYGEDAEIVEGDLFPKCKILGRCLEVRYLRDYSDL